MKSYFYSDSISKFITSSTQAIFGTISQNSGIPDELTQKGACTQEIRIKPYAIDVKSPMDPIHWFLDDKGDIRSSYYLEDVATEFQVQGLKLDWAYVSWDGDFRYSPVGWKSFSLVGSKWNNINKERKLYLKNA